MDVIRTDARRRRWTRRAAYVAAAAMLVGGASMGLSRLKPASPGAERSSLVFDTVKRGLMLREVRGPGKLVPEEVLWISSPVDGRVQSAPLLPGVSVKPDTVLVELANPELMLATTNAQWAARSAEAEITAQQARLHNEVLELQAGMAKEEAALEEAVLQHKVDQQLFKDELISEHNLALSKGRVANLEKLIRIDGERFRSHESSITAQLAVQRAKVEQAKAEYALKGAQVESLKVRACVDGVLEQLKVEVGQRIAAGSIVAKVTNPRKLKASLKIPETQAHDIAFGQKVVVDTRSSLVTGHVVRIDPAADAGTVTIDVTIDGPLPREARPDLSVDGTIELERLENVLYVGRPVYGQPNTTANLFKVAADGGAVRLSVRFGRTSVNCIEVLEGLAAGDQVILSDTKEWDAYGRLQLH
jgi:HlyD family secretion protein